MISTSCHCGQIHYRIFTTVTITQASTGVQFIKANGLIENSNQSLERFVTTRSETQSIREHGFCGHCGASIYILDNQGYVSYAINHLSAYQVEHSGALNFGL
ncbi:hypothetical protein EAG18_07460 [Pseudoalteromonas sp. J010]|uniref:hypothetical protein n=1 Tax=Pseudoalteromonas sp. J010 TaxID=998465 RepID=UPI000F64DCAE|nr:hypothetical protein [Pseudoalteromonas sp. J010]RRS09271.1 hypothetical protein EAG18_07460 [Pseudoalteromonas sp. J010]